MAFRKGLGPVGDSLSGMVDGTLGHNMGHLSNIVTAQSYKTAEEMLLNSTLDTLGVYLPIGSLGPVSWYLFHTNNTI